MEEPPKTDNKNEVEKDNQLSELVEVVVETEAEVGASGYSVVGGGEQGIFIKEVLKDSPAAKHLSLQKGDQLLSARVYFDNVKYEDALKILQCAEPYKVSFFLKRTVPGSEVSIRPGAQNLELRGPKAKMQKMSVKSVKPFKTKKRRGGRFGLKRLKENKKARARAELDVEGLPGRSDLSPVDVEFVLPKFKIRKGGKATADGSEHLEGVITSTKKKRKIRFPKMKAKDAAVGEGKVNVDVSTHEGEASGSKLKVKMKGPKFGMNFPKIKKSKLQSSNESFEVKELEGKFKPPSVESDFNKAEMNVSNFEVSVKGKGEGPEIKMPRTNLDVSDMKVTVPKFKLPKVRLSYHSDEIDGEASKETDTSENKLKMPKIDIKAPNVDLDLHPPKTKGKAKFKDVEVPDFTVKGTKINTTKPDTLLPVLNLDAKQTFEDDIDGSMDIDHKISLPKPDITGSKIKTSDVDIGLPTLDVSLPKMATKSIDTEGHVSTGVKFEMKQLDISLPKITSPEGKVIVEGPGAKGKGEAKVDSHSEKGPSVKIPPIDVSLPKMKLPQGKIDIEGPGVDISLPKETLEGDANIEGHFGKGGEIKMPRVDVSLPNVKSSEHAIAKGHDVKAGKLSMPSIEISLPTGKTEVGADISLSKGKTNEQINLEVEKGDTFEIPKSDISLPKLKLGEVDFDIKKTDGKFHMPAIDISLPHRKDQKYINVEPSSKGGKVEMPKVDISLPAVNSSGFEISLPKMKLPQGDISIEGPDSKGLNMPPVDISFPKVTDTGNVELKRHSGKIGKFDIPKLDISLPKFESTKGELSVKGPEFKGGTLNIPTYNISSAEVKTEGDVYLEGETKKGTKFQTPKLDINLPQIKSVGTDKNFEGPELKGGKIDMPDVDISLPKGKLKGDGKVRKTGKFHLPQVDLSLPKIKTRSVEVNIEGPEIKGSKVHTPSLDISLPKHKTKTNIDIESQTGTGIKYEMPNIDVSLPKVTAPEGDVAVEGPAGKGRKFEMPKFDASLPKLKPSGGEINVEGPDIKGGKFHMPSIDISLPGGRAGGDVDFEGSVRKGGKFEMPKLDVSLPKLKPSAGEINIEGPDIKGRKFHMPSIDISLPRGGAGGDVDVEGPAGKGRKFKMPKLDVSLPELKPSAGEINVEGPDIKGGKFHMPSIDVSLPGNAEGRFALGDKTKKGLKFHMPTVDISVPKMKLTDHELKVGSEKKDIDLTYDSDIENKASGAKISDLNVPEVTLGGNIKLPSVKIPTVNISAPKVDLDFALPKAKGGDRESIELLKAEGGRPSSGASFDVPEVSVKMPKISLPKFGRKLKSGDKLELESPDFSTDLEMDRTSPSKKDTEIMGPDTEMKIKAGAGEFRVEGSEDKVKSKLKFPKFKTPTPKAKLKDVEMGMPGYLDNKGKVRMPAVEISLPTANIPECEVLLPKTEVDVSEADIRSYEGSLKIPKMPTIDISVPKVDLDVSLPRVKLHESVDSSDLSTDSTRGTVNFPHVKNPKVDISFPHGTMGDTVNHEVEAGRKGKLRMPKVEISLPHAKHDTSYTDTEIKGEKLKILKMSVPSVDISLPRGKVNDDPDIEFGGKGNELKKPDIIVPKIDLSLPHGRKEESPMHDSELKGGKIKMPTTDIPLPKIKSKDVVSEPDVGKGKVKTPGIRGSVEAEGGQCKMPDIKIPQVDISLPESRTGEFDTKEGESGRRGGKLTMPNVKISKIDMGMSRDSEMSDPSIDVSLKDSHKQGKKTRMPNVDLELDLGLSKDGKKDKKKSELQDTDLEPAPKEKIKGPKVKGTKFNIGMPKVKVSGLETDINNSEKMDAKFLKGGTDANLKAPKTPDLDFDIETAQTGTNNLDEDKKQTGKVKIPKFGIPLPSLSSPEANIKSSQGKGHSLITDSEVEYESPRLPKVTKAVFVMVNQQTEGSASVSGEASAEIGDVKIKQPKIKMKPSFGKSKSRSNEKGKAMYCEDEVETERKSKTAKLKLPKVTFSSGQRGSFDVTPSGSDDGTSPSLNGDKDEKSMFGKLKFPKVEFFSPYSKDASEEEGMETSVNLRKETSGESKESKESKTVSGTMSSPGLEMKTEKDEEVRKISTIVSSKARTEMLAEREGSESPVPTVSSGFVSVMKCEEREETTWFKIPKVSLSPHSTAILHITPESSPKGSKSSLPCSSEEASGGFYVKMPSVEFLTHEMPSEHLITKTEGTLTVVTKTTKYTETKGTSSKQ